MELRGKMQKYVEGRLAGMAPQVAGSYAGYGKAGLKVAVCKLEKRSDIQAILKGNAPAQEEVIGGRGEKWEMRNKYANPLELFLDVMNNPKAPVSMRYQAAKDAAPYCHARKEGGKKQEKMDNAKANAAAKQRFQTGGRPSHLRSVG